jgi:hypothetical protein
MTILIDADSIVLKALLKYYSKTKSQKIRRAVLLNLSGSKGSELAPATFQRCLDRLEKIHIINRSKVGRITVIQFRVGMISSTLEKKTKGHNLKFQNLTEEIEPETWESLFESTMDKIIKEVALTWTPHENTDLRYGDTVTKKAMSGIIGMTISHSIELFILQNSWKLPESERKEAIEDLIKAVGKFTKGNPDEPFTITIQFNGMRQTLEKLTEFYHPMIQKIAPYLLIFSERVLNHRFSQKDKYFLRRSRIDELSSPARKCFDIFMSRISTLIPKSAYRID